MNLSTPRLRIAPITRRAVRTGDHAAIRWGRDDEGEGKKAYK